MEEKLKIAFDAATGLGTMFLAVVAIWGDGIKRFLFRPKMKLELRSNTAQIATINGEITAFYHLRLQNLGRFAVPNCQVLLTGYSREDASMRFVVEELVMPLQLPWAPHEPGKDERERTLVQQLTVDFLKLSAAPSKVNLRLIDLLQSVDVDLHADQGRIRYRLSVQTPNARPLDKCFQVSWDGKWHPSAGGLKRSLVIEEVPTLNSPR